MIVTDIETSGFDTRECGIVSVGAIDFLCPKNQFYMECRLEREDRIFEGIPGTALKHASEVNGFSEDEMRDPKKASQAELLENFFKWCWSCRTMLIAGENVSFDLGFIEARANKYGLTFPFGHRSLDLHTLAQTKYLNIYGKFLLDEKGKSSLGLKKCLEFCGLKDERKIHNALDDAKLEAECFSRLLNGKSLFEDYTKFEIPEYLKNDP